MPDELDMTQDRIDLEMRLRIEAERCKQIHSPKGTCLYCLEPCAADASFCDDECAADYKEEQSILEFQRSGQRATK